jgi:hypothetical protein
MGRPRKYCSNKCRQADFRERKAQDRADADAAQFDGLMEDLNDLAHEMTFEAIAEGGPVQ